jgi:polyhydroxybutyrate depolymerase
VKTSPDISLVVDEEQLEVDGRRRSYRVVRPAAPGPDAVLVLALHGSNQSGAGLRRFSGGTFDALAAGHGAVVVYPDSTGALWNDARRTIPGRARAEGVDDVAFLTAVLDRVAERHRLTDRRALVAGYSNGGQMALRLLFQTTGRLRGVVLFGATLPTPEDLVVDDRGDRVPVTLVHGTKDPNVPFGGGTASLFGFRPRGTVLSAPESARRLAERNGADAEPQVHVLAEESAGTSVTVTHHAGAAPVTLYTVVGGGHVVPNRRRRAFPLLGRTTRAVDGGELVWELAGA